MWLRALIACDDVRLELGGTVSLIGVYADRIVVPPGDGEIVLPRLAIYTVVAGLAGATELAWRQWLSAGDTEPEAPIAEGRDPHDPGADEHRIVNLLAPLALPGPGRYRLTIELETRRERKTIDHTLVVERLPAQADAA
jgi:hypothetical protein